MASISYNGQGPSLRDLVGNIVGLFGGRRLERKEAQFPAYTGLQMTPFQARWSGDAPSQVIQNSFKGNSAVLACTMVWATSYPEPTLKVYDRASKKVIPTHPLSQLLERPNEIMGQDELWLYEIVYKLLGGNNYMHILKARNGTPGELYPYHFGQIAAVPAGPKWVDHYEFHMGNGSTQSILREDIIHTKWPLPDPTSPWQAMAPLVALAKEIGIDNELTRFVKGLLQNDAVMRGVLKLAAGVNVTEKRRKELKADFVTEHGGNRVGGLAVLEAGMEYERIAMNFDELEAGGLRNAEHALIAGVLRVPPQLAHLPVGLEHQIYNNVAEARYGFTQLALIPFWKATAAEVQSSLLPYFGDPTKQYVAFDLTEVEALKAAKQEAGTRAINAKEKGILTVNEARAELGYPPIEGGDVLAPSPAPLVQMADANQQKFLDLLLETKAVAPAMSKLEKQMQADLEAELQAMYDEAAGAVK